MVRATSSTKRLILDAAEDFLAEHESSELRISDIAKTANVGVPTLYYYFDSRSRLIAEAQLSAYLKIVQPPRRWLDKAEAALIHDDLCAFTEAVGENVARTWTYGRGIEGWKAIKVLVDIWSDPETQTEFCAILDEQLESWIAALEQAKARGWIDQRVNVTSLVTSCWAGSVGHAVFMNSTKIDYSPDDIRDFFLLFVNGGAR